MRPITIILLVMSCAQAQVTKSDFKPLTPKEADAIVQQEMKAQEEAAEAQRKRLEAMPAIYQSEADLGGRKVKFNRVQIQSPAPAAASLSEVGTASPAMEQQAADIKERLEQGTIIPIFINATVYDGEISEFTWAYNGQAYTGFANINFHFLRNIREAESGGITYSPTIAVGSSSREVLKETNQRAIKEGWPNFTPKELPVLSPFSAANGVEYTATVVSANGKYDEEAFAGIEAIFQCYLENQMELQTLYQRQEELQAAKERYLEAHPPQPRDSIVNFAPSADSASLHR